MAQCSGSRLAPAARFSSVITRATETGDIRSKLAKVIGAKGYHT